MLTRRAFLCRSALSLCALPALAQPENADIQALAQAYMRKYDVPGLSLAYGRGARILFAAGFGSANLETHEPVTSRSLFRIASLSKPITSAAIYTLVQTGRLRTSDHVFGPKGLLSGFALHTRPELLQNLTVKHLLTHTAGGWGNEEHDPMFHNKDRDRSVFLQRTLNDYPLQDRPGAAFHYSNFGYFLLGRVIEHVSGQPYPDYVQQHVLQPLGLTDMRLGTRSPASNEVRYSGQDHTDPYAVPIELHDANGGWIATPSDLVHFALGVFSSQDKAGAPVLFTPETLAQMTQGSPARPTYASGWAISPDLDYLHTGALDGTASFLMHRHDGLAWAIVANTRRPHSSMENDMHELSWAIARRLQL